MPCYHPRVGFVEKGTDGKNIVKMGKPLKDSTIDLDREDRILLPCGKCIGCRLERARQWAMRCMCEAQEHEIENGGNGNCFLTLTYNDKHMPKNRSLNKKDIKLFIRRLRYAFPNQKIRYFQCGEYGWVCRKCGKPKWSPNMPKGSYCICSKFEGDLGRPHHHVVLFGFDFHDKEVLNEKSGLCRSNLLESLWPYGYSTVGDLTFESASYVARYCTKKINGPKADSHYKGRTPEFVTMSLRPAIAKSWFKKYGCDVYPHDFIIVRGGYKQKPPRYFDKLLELDNPSLFATIKDVRKGSASKSSHNSFKRLQQREKVKKAQVKNLERRMEHGKRNFQYL